MQTNKPFPSSRVLDAFSAGIKSLATPVLALLGLMLVALATPAIAQEAVFISATPSRVTEPFNFSGTNSVNVNLSIVNNGTNEVDLTLSGLPAGASATLSKTAFTNSGSATLTFTLANVAEGIYWLTLNATNTATNFLNFPLQVGDVWSGVGANKNWSTTGNWNGGTVPGASDDVIFNQGNAQTGTNTNSIVDITTTIASLRFATTNSSTNFQDILINPNVTLNVTGTNSLSELRDIINVATSMNAMIAGQGGALKVANESGNIALLTDDNVKSLMDMQKLGFFTADVNRVGVGDINAYPNYTNIVANENPTSSSQGRPKLYLPTWNLAMTNIIKAVYVDPYNYTNSTNRAYALEVGNNGNQASGSTAQLLIAMGVSNLFLLDSICVAGAGGTVGTLNFNTNFASLNPTAYFRNTDGLSRMSMFAVADAANYFTNGTGNTKANSFNGVDFADGKGYVNALVDRFIMSRDSPISINGGITAQSQMEIGQGVFDCNSAYLGDQSQGNQLQINYCQATLTVSNTAVFIVRTNLELGYETASINDTSDPGSTFGQLNVTLGGTVQANQINVGGVTKTSGLVGSNDGHGGLNQITLGSGGTLIVSNTIADSTQNGALGLLSFTGNGILELFIDGSLTRTNVYATTVSTSGSGNTIKIGGISNLTLPAQVPLIQYAAGSPTLSVSVPAGDSGAIINNGAGKTIDVYITQGAPKTLVWRGYQSAVWDTTTKNWLDLNTGLQTNFANLDVVFFDDTAGIPTSIALSGLLIPGTVGMTNTLNSYTFNGPGTTSGSAVLTKMGAGSLDVEATTTLSVNLNQGTLTGGGTINSITSASGTTVNYSGTVSAGLTCSGTATSSGTISGFLDVKGGGIFTNLNTLNGPITLETNSFVNNEGTIQNMFPSGSIATNAFLLNSGQLNDGGSTPALNGTLTVNGTFEDTGAGSMSLFRLTLAAGCIFIPGDGGVGLTQLNSDGNNVVGSFPGRLSMAAGSRTLIYVNGNNSTKVNCGYVDYGPSQSGQAQNGSTLIITNLGSPYTAGQVFQVVGNQGGGDPFPDGTSTNSFPILVPDKPGPNLAWDLSHLWPHGQIGVIVPPVFTLTNSFARVSTNIVSSFSWPQAEFGWALEIQQNTLQVGLSTNWTRLAGSWTNSSVNITNTAFTSNNAVFYRLVYP